MNGVASGAASGERFGWAMFIAVAAHGLLILGVSFAPPPSAGPEEVPTLEVTLLDLPVPDQPVPENAQYLAQASQEGTGNVDEQVRPEFFDRPPAPDEADAHERGLEVEYSPPQPETPAAERVTARFSPTTAPVAPQPAEPEAQPAAMPPPGGITRVTASGEREHFVAVNARESVFAEYLAGWKARMERIGTINYPTIAGRRGGDPVLEVAVAADGSLREVRVTRSSGHGGLDQAAIDLVRLATPFDPFPPVVRAQYDVLRFAYEWRFIEGRAAAGRLHAAPD